MSDDEGFRPDLKHKARRGFTESTRLRESRSAPAKQRETNSGDIQRRAAVVRGKLRDHQHKMKPVWVARERARLARKHPEKLTNTLSDGPRMLGMGSNRHVNHQARLSLQAETNVNARCAQRLRRLDRIEHDMLRAHGRERKRQR